MGTDEVENRIVSKNITCKFKVLKVLRYCLYVEYTHLYDHGSVLPNGSY